MKQEIERKYAVATFSENLKVDKAEEIEQGFIYRDFYTLIRIRKITPIYPEKKESYFIYTIKTKGDISYTGDYTIGQKYELEQGMAKEEYEKLMPKRISQTIRKTRIVVPIENQLKVEIDIYDDYLEGLLTAEIEFPDKETASHFTKPSWLGEELGYKEFSNRRLSEMTTQEWKSKMSSERLAENEKWIAHIKQRIRAK